MPVLAAEDDAYGIDPFPLWKLLPVTKEYYRYYGGLTVPPCSENVVWIIFRKTIKISSAQVIKWLDQVTWKVFIYVLGRFAEPVGVLKWQLTSMRGRFTFSFMTIKYKTIILIDCCYFIKVSFYLTNSFYFKNSK